MKGDRGSWGCKLTDILVERRKDGKGVFRLAVPDLVLRRNGTTLNKLPIMGISGAGKSTLMNVMAAIEWPQSEKGKVTWRFPDGNVVSWGAGGVTPGQTRLLRQQYFGFAFQSSTLIPHLTIEENLTYPMEMRGVPRTKARQKAAAVLDQVMRTDVDAMLHSYPFQLSGGEMQRVALIQSLIHDPVVLFTDEPTGSLDPVTRKTVMKVLTEWVAEAPDRRMLIWVTHHERDPQEQDVGTRLDVCDGTCRWQSWNEGLETWEDRDADH